jgi:chromate reductase, NAD(P)H dehydrogenase (quinone)
MAKPIEILGLCGSLRKNSYNRAALRAAQEMAAPDARIEIAEIGAIPLYDDDLREADWPEAAALLCRRIAEADAVLIVSPEYNYSVPGTLKNAIDWVSRWPDQPFAGKPVGVVGASPGRIGTARMQYHLRQVFVFLDAAVLNKPEVMIAGAADLFEDGKLTDAKTAEMIGKMVEALVAAARKRAEAI